MWTSEILAELLRNGPRVLERQGMTPDRAITVTGETVRRMRAAFPDGELDTERWESLLPEMLNDPGDRHVLAAAVGAGATHVVTENLRHFPVAARPVGIVVRRPDAFLLELLDRDERAVFVGVEAMASRHRRPAHSPLELAGLLEGGRYTSRFGRRLLHLHEVGVWGG